MTAKISDKIYLKLILILLGLSVCVSCSAEQGQGKLRFSFSALTDNECSQLLIENVITKNNPVPCNRLNRVNFSYINELGVIKQDGILIIRDGTSTHYFCAIVESELLQ